MAGASVAAHLAADRRVLVLERESQPGYHSTGRSAALFSAIYGSEPVRALSRASHDFFYTPPSGFAQAPLVRERPAMHIATAEQAERLAAFAALPDVAAVSRKLTRDEALALCPILRADQIHSAVVETEAA